MALFTGSGDRTGCPELMGCPMSASRRARRSSLAVSVTSRVPSSGGPHVSGCPRHPETGHRDDVALQFVGPAAEGVDHGKAIGALELALERCGGAFAYPRLADDVEELASDLLGEFGTEHLRGG